MLNKDYESSETNSCLEEFGFVYFYNSTWITRFDMKNIKVVSVQRNLKTPNRCPPLVENDNDDILSSHENSIESSTALQIGL